jgi:hypothetical protein
MRGIRWFGVFAVVSVLITACASGLDEDGVATLGDGDAADGAAPSPSVDPEEALQAFAECMRENGIEGFQDPELDEDGRITFGRSAGDGDVDQAPGPGDLDEFEDAMQACRDLLPEGLGPGNISPEEEAAFQDALLKYAQCMREHGIDMPDPDFSEGGGVIATGGDGVDPNDPEFQDADDACRHLIEDVGPEAAQEGGSDDAGA